jgi:hypothetical protein
VDGRLREARMNHPKGFTVDDKGNIYVADAMNMAIRKISDTGKLKWPILRQSTWHFLVPPGTLCLFCGFPGASPALIIYLCPKLHPERGMLSVCLKIVSPAVIW